MFHGLANAAEAALRLAGDIEWKTKQFPGLTGTNEPLADPLSAGALHHASLSIKPGLEFGVVVDYVPYCQAYRVMPETLDVPILCCRSRSLPASMIGVTDADTLQPYTPVYFIRHPRNAYGIIIAVEPGPMRDPRLAMSDIVSQGSRCGLQVEPAHQAPFKLGGKDTHGGIHDWSARNPVDNLETGQFCRVAETGLMLQLDSYMGQFRVDEMCGLWMFYWDQLLRIAGTNLQQWTSASELESYDDGGEHFWYHGIGPYPWEQLGSLAGPDSPYTLRDAALVQLLQPWYARMEPEFDDLQPFHRLRRYAGYIGQGERRVMCVPPPGGVQQRYSVESAPTGLFEEVLTLAGHYGMRTATSLTIGKRPVIVVPKRMKKQADPRGDDAAGGNYRAAGFYTSADSSPATHNAKPSPDVPDIDLPHLAASASVADLHAYLFNWASPQAFHHHQEDYHFPEEEDYETIPANQQEVLYGNLREKWYLDPPTPIAVKVDHREDSTTQVYPNQSYLSFLDDGGVVIGDGYGAEIRMSGGQIRITAPGDVFLEAGRNVISWAGRDAIVRAKNSADISATDSDVRVKAKKNVQVIGGNGGGPYGIMLDCRGTSATYDFTEPGEATQHGGIIFVTKDAPLVAWAQDIYLRSVDLGSIVLDAGRGNGDITMHANFVDRFVVVGAADYFGAEGSITAANAWFEAGAAISGTIRNTGAIVSDGQHLINGSFVAVGGHIVTEQAQNNPDVSALDGLFLEASTASIDTVRDFQREQTSGGNDRFDSNLDEKWYAADKAGNDNIIGVAAASMRVTEDYGTEDFILFESRWAREARENEQSLTTWEEEPVAFGSTDTYPFPGTQAFVNDEVYFQQDAALHDPQTGNSKPRAELEDAELNEPTPVNLNSEYLVIG